MRLGFVSCELYIRMRACVRDGGKGGRFAFLRTRILHTRCHVRLRRDRRASLRLDDILAPHLEKRGTRTNPTSLFPWPWGSSRPHALLVLGPAGGGDGGGTLRVETRVHYTLDISDFA